MPLPASSPAASPRPLRIHLIGIGGTAMASLAGLLQQLGHRVQGSDQPLYPPMSTVLADLGIRPFEGYDPAHLEPAPDLVVVGNAIPRGNPELEAVLDRDLPYESMPALLRRLVLAERRRLVVTGTHGKTTTTNLAAWLLHASGVDCGWLVGGLPRDLPANHRLGARGAPFVLEGDEYDTAYFDKAPKFFHYRPQRLVINAVEFDHADIYADIDAIELQFRRLVNTVPGNGRVIVWSGDRRALALARTGRAALVRFAVGPLRAGEDEPEYWAPAQSASGGGIDFELRIRGRDCGVWHLPLAGDFNLRNALAALALCEGLTRPSHGSGAAASDPALPLVSAGPPSAASGGAEALTAGPPAGPVAATGDRSAPVGAEALLRQALAQVRGPRRRLELRGEVGGIRVYDDFAHHPTAVAAAIGALLPLTRGRLIAVLEPRSWTLRRRVFETEVATALAAADESLLAPVYLPERLAAEERLRPERVVEKIQAFGKPAAAFGSVGDLIEEILRIVRPGDAILVMSNGGFEGIHQRLLRRLAAASPNPPSSP